MIKISDLPAASALGGTEVIAGVQTGVTVKILVSAIGTYVRGLFTTTPATIAEGGTSAASAAAARTALGAAASDVVSAALGVTVQAYDADTLKADTADVLTAGFAATPYNAGTKSSGTFTPDEANGNFQYCVNGGAFTLAPPTNNCTMIIQITNNGSAGAITTSGFTKVSGVAPGTTNGDDFLAYITKINGFSHLSWQALQ